MNLPLRSIPHLALLAACLAFAPAEAATKPSIEAQILSAQDRAYRTRVRDALREPANFAGHYVLTDFGCGTSCEMAFAIDKQTGRTAWLPFIINSTETDGDP